MIVHATKGKPCVSRLTALAQGSFKNLLRAEGEAEPVCRFGERGAALCDKRLLRAKLFNETARTSIPFGEADRSEVHRLGWSLKCGAHGCKVGLRTL